MAAGRLRRLEQEYGSRLNFEHKAWPTTRDRSRYAELGGDQAARERFGNNWRKLKDQEGGEIFNPDLFISRTFPMPVSWPALAAVKAAGRQGDGAYHRYLDRARVAYFSEALDFSQRDVLVGIARDAGLDVAQFERDLHAGWAEQAARDDLAEANALGVPSVPTVVVVVQSPASADPTASAAPAPVLISGVQPEDDYRAALDRALAQVTA